MCADSPSLQPRAIAELMTQLRNGDANAAGKLVGHLYPELRRLAAAKLSMATDTPGA